jgi:HEAT repeat protein
MMPEVRWKVYLLFALITLSIFGSISLSRERIGEGIGNGSGNETYLLGAKVSNETSIADLINQLGTGGHETRLDTAARIGKSGEPAADVLIEKIEANASSSEEINSYMLLALLETRDGRVEKTLSGTLGKKGTAHNTTAGNTVEEQAQGEISDDILQAIEAKDKTMRKSLADSLNMDYKEKTDALEAALKAEEQNSSIYDSIVLSQFGPEEPGSETEKLLKALKSDSGSMRIAAIMALGERKEKAAVDPMIGILTRDYPPVQSSAAFALGEIGDERAIEILLKQMKDGESDTIKINAAIALGKMGKETTVPNLIDRLRDNKAAVRSSAALSLGKIGNETAVGPLIDILNSGKLSDGRAKDSINANEDVRKSAVLALGEIRKTEATEILTGILTDKEEKLSVRIAAASALGKIGDPGALETIKKVLEDKSMDVNIRKEAFLALGKTKNQEAAGILVAKLGDKEFGASSREALIDMGEMAVDPLIGNLKTTDKKMKDETALILIEIGDPRAVKPLIEAYQ